MNYRELYEQGNRSLTEAGIEEAALDARLLLEAVCETDRSYLLAHGERAVTEEQRKSYVNLIEKRRQRIPLQHILGYQDFMGLHFQVTPEVLIPRQDTETLVEEVMRNLHDGMRILDLCTGSGCILLSLLRYSNGCQGTGTDISGAALAVARRNAMALGVEAAWIESNLFEQVTGKYDVLVSNPPYIPTGVIPTLMEEVREHDPLIALDGGEDGLDFYRKIAEQAPSYMYAGGEIYLEIGSEQAEAVSCLLTDAGFLNVTVYQDLSGLDRVVRGRRA